MMKTMKTKPARQDRGARNYTAIGAICVMRETESIVNAVQRIEWLLGRGRDIDEVWSYSAKEQIDRIRSDYHDACDAFRDATGEDPTTVEGPNGRLMKRKLRIQDY